MGKRKQSGLSLTFILMVLLLISMILGGVYIKTSSDFEKELPKVQLEEEFIWNKKTPIEIKLSDNKGIKYYKIEISDGKKNINVAEENVAEDAVKEKIIVIEYPKSEIMDRDNGPLSLKLTIIDTSYSNYFNGNELNHTVSIPIDNTRPKINVVSNSYMVTQGGSALVVFYAEDKNLEEVYVEDGMNKFKAQPYRKKGYYAALIAWPFNVNYFNPMVVAVDKAGNRKSQELNFYTKNHKYRTSHIRANDNFINGKITDLASTDSDYQYIEDKVEKFKAVNEDMRLKNEDLIHRLTKNISNEYLEGWNIKRFYPLRNGQRVASYGDERHYYYKDKSNVISHSYHVGYDLASVKMADIKTSNSGMVVYAKENGIYGNMPIIDHGLGLYSIYGHCSTMNVKEGDIVKSGDVIGKTGVSGLALGDHLHFGLLVQGVEVRPVEWFDKDWIRKSIGNVFKEADKVIDGK